jgi:hypothetical protein
MRSLAIILLLAAVSPSWAILPATNEPECIDNLGKPCDKGSRGYFECCTTQGFIYCGWGNSTFAWAPTRNSNEYCHTNYGPPDGSVYICESGECPDQNANRFTIIWLDRISATGDVVGYADAPEAQSHEYTVWNILKDTTGYMGDVP